MSQPWALAGTKFLIINDISSSTKWNDVILALVLCNTLGLLLVYILSQKMLLKIFPSSQKSESNLPSTNTGGIAGIFSL